MKQWQDDESRPPSAAEPARQPAVFSQQSFSQWYALSHLRPQAGTSREVPNSRQFYLFLIKCKQQFQRQQQRRRDRRAQAFKAGGIQGGQHSRRAAADWV